ncbi:splicing regulatory glutamine lysine-rich 1 isoform X5 [Labeo rohita]|uniref:Splicing regulatory glutamine lysine-rich 1 isoform X5 n=1 Tax=Labeo rohita TaxID=84645 RepID=A0A498M921_LABRO|nr:splicing regulatory glutamine lysine-rich 1 isoform X5 [Labeo rohita]
MSGMPGTNVIQITNLSSAVSSDQMRTLFGFLGDIEELRLYPPDNAPLSFSSKVCYIKYREPSSVGVAQHLTNTVFIDRALIVVPCAEGKIPEEAKALSLLAPAAPVTSLMSGGGLLPIPSPATLQNSTTAEQLLKFFKQVGDVKFVRMAGDETQPTRFAFVEFADQESVARALTFNGVMFGDRPLKDRRKDKDSKVRKDDDWEEKRPRDKKGRTSPKGYSGSRRSCSISRGHKKRSRSRSRSPKRRARGKKDRKRDKGRDISRERTESSTSRRKSRDYEHKAKPLLMERGYEQADHEYDSDMDGSGSVGTDDRSPQVHLNGSYGSTYAEEDDLSAAE